jgi:hypothetical protein
MLECKRGWLIRSNYEAAVSPALSCGRCVIEIHNGCWLRPVCWDVFLICACSKWRDRCENTAASMKCIRVDAENRSFFVPIYKEEGKA